MKNKTPWVVLQKEEPGGPPLRTDEVRAQCLRCKTGFLATLPMDLAQLAKAMKAFARDHRKCKAAKK